MGRSAAPLLVIHTLLVAGAYGLQPQQSRRWTHSSTIRNTRSRTGRTCTPSAVGGAGDQESVTVSFALTLDNGAEEHVSLSGEKDIEAAAADIAARHGLCLLCGR